MTTRFADRFAACARENRPALGIFTIAGDPDLATSTAILIDVFPPKQRGLALGINIMAAIAGQFIGLVLGGLLADIDWRLVFYINIPVGVIGTIWAFLSLKDVGIEPQ